MSNEKLKSVKLKVPLRGARSGGERKQRPDPECSGELARERKRLEEMRRSLATYEMELHNRESDLEQKENDLDIKISRLSHLLSSVEEEKAEVLRSSEEEIVSFSLNIVNKVLQSEIENGRYKIDQIIKSTLQDLQTKNAMALRVNPQDHDLARAAVSELGNTYGSTNMKVVPDESIPLASCCIETKEGKIYSEIPGRLKRVKDALLTDGD